LFDKKLSLQRMAFRTLAAIAGEIVAGFRQEYSSSYALVYLNKADILS